MKSSVKYLGGLLLLLCTVVFLVFRQGLLGSCTLMGALQVLTVTQSGDRHTFPYRVEIQMPDGVKFSVLCSSADSRTPDGDFYCHKDGATFRIYQDWDQAYGGAPSRLKVVTTTNEENEIHEISPTYQVQELNGPGCPPKSYKANLVISENGA